MRSAIIDNGIDIETLCNYKNKTKSFMVCHEKVISCEPPQYITHGGACAKVFASQAGMLPDISICLNRDSADMSNASDLANAGIAFIML